MTQTWMSVDVEALLSQFLRAQPEIAAIVGQRVYTDLPNAADRIYPLILLNRAGSTFAAHGYLESTEIRADCYGLTHKQARTLAGLYLNLLVTRLRGRYPAGPVVAEGAVTGVSLAGLSYEPDEDTADEDGHARPRYIAVANVHTHS